MNRKDILQKIIEEQNTVIESLERSVDRYKIASDIDEESTHDPEDFSHQTEAKDMQLRFEKMLGNAESDLLFLEKEIENTHEKIENGCIIDTEKHLFFVGISVQSFTIDGKELISFSEDAPVFQNFLGKNIGDEVQFAENTVRIQSIL